MAKGRVNKDERLVILRRFDAPRGLVFNAFTDPEHLMRWWGPKDFKMLYCKLDLRRGGMFHYCAQPATGDLVWGHFIYREILPLQRIVFLDSFSGSPVEILHKVTFTEHEGKTVVKFTGDVIDASEYNFMFDKLENHLNRIAALQKI